MTSQESISIGEGDSHEKETQDVLTFWFEEIEPKQQFTKDPAFDALVRKRFEETYRRIMNGETKHWRETPEGRLAEIIVLDQFSRNMFRGDKQSFAGDTLALRLAKEAVAVSADTQVPKDRRTFFYMPYMHSESKEVHEEALDIFTKHGNKLNLEYEIKHKDIIDRFGRYPHRNEVLGRKSTPEELEFLKEHDGF